MATVIGHDGPLLLVAVLLMLAVGLTAALLAAIRSGAATRTDARVAGTDADGRRRR